MASVFPDGMLPLNRSILPCGRDCSTIGFTAHDHRASQVVLSIFSSISVASIIFSFVVYFFNRHNLARHFLRRATMMFLACAGLGESIYMFSAKGATSDSILCYSDGTLVTHPTSSDVWCWWTAIQSHLFSTMAIGYTIVLTYTWHQVAQLLCQPGSCRKNSGAHSSMTTWWTNYQRDFVSFVLVLIPSLGVVIAVSAQQGYEALPLFGVCSESAERGFVGYYTWYHVAAIIPNMIFLIRGVHVLVRKHGVLGVVRWVKDDNAFGNSQSMKRRATVTSSAPHPVIAGLEALLSSNVALPFPVHGQFYSQHTLRSLRSDKRRRLEQTNAAPHRVPDHKLLARLLPAPVQTICNDISSSLGLFLHGCVYFHDLGLLRFPSWQCSRAWVCDKQVQVYSHSPVPEGFLEESEDSCNCKRIKLQQLQKRVGNVRDF